jgi:hypothetical protein
MAGRQKEQERITEADVVGLKYFDRLAPLLGRLRDVGCERDRAGNRELHFDQYFLLVLSARTPAGASIAVARPAQAATAYYESVPTCSMCPRKRLR